MYKPKLPTTIAWYLDRIADKIYTVNLESYCREYNVFYGTSRYSEKGESNTYDPKNLFETEIKAVEVKLKEATLDHQRVLDNLNKIKNEYDKLCKETGTGNTTALPTKTNRGSNTKT